MSMSNSGWDSIDKSVERKIINKIEFIRPIGLEALKIYCNDCNILVSTVEDCESMKENNLCEACFVNKSFINKDNIYN